MILPASTRYLPIPGAGLATITVFNPDPRVLARETAMMRLSTGKFDLLTAHRRAEAGQPVYWTIRDDGRGEVWPVPDQEYRLRARDTAGRDPDARAKPVGVFPVAETVTAVNRQHEEAMAKEAAERAGHQGPQPEYFSRRPMGGGDE